MLTNKLTQKLIRISTGCYDLPNSNKKHFSFILRRNKIISFGYNNGWKSSPISAKFGHRFYAIHSELAAIKNFPYPISELPDFTLVNIRLNARRELANSEPCFSCRKMLIYFGMKDIVFSSAKGEFLNL